MNNCVYLAASLFSAFDRERNNWIRKELNQAGYTVFLPQEIVAPVDSDGNLDYGYVYTRCRDAICECGTVIALVDGPDVDSGVAWELGFAHAKNIPCYCVRTDFRKSEHKGVNIMIGFGATDVLYLTGYSGNQQQVIEALIQLLGEKRKK